METTPALWPTRRSVRLSRPPTTPPPCRRHEVLPGIDRPLPCYGRSEVLRLDLPPRVDALGAIVSRRAFLLAARVVRTLAVVLSRRPDHPLRLQDRPRGGEGVSRYVRALSDGALVCRSEATGPLSVLSLTFPCSRSPPPHFPFLLASLCPCSPGRLLFGRVLVRRHERRHVAWHPPPLEGLVRLDARPGRARA